MVVLGISKETIEIPEGGEVILRDRTWKDYEKLLNLRQDRAALRVRFNAKTREIKIMSPLPGHGNRVATLTDLVKILLRHQGREWHGFDPITLKLFQQGGIEPDACFYLENRQKILGKERFDLDRDTPPDLAFKRI